MKKNNKGFTLVELIVVLVILAILAAILVPALLGYIDRAREKQYVLNAKSALTAAQAELSSLYGEGKSADLINKTKDASRAERVSLTADVPDSQGFWVAPKTDTAAQGAKSTNHGAYTVGEALYKENDVYIYFDGSSWEKVTDKTSLAWQVW